jgi:hypothetical protein
MTKKKAYLIVTNYFIKITDFWKFTKYLYSYINTSKFIFFFFLKKIKKKS